MTAQPIPVRVLRHQCPFCSRTHSRPGTAREHIARCWRNPEVRGCKTCKYFEQDPGEPDVGLMGGESCDMGVDLDGRPACAECGGHDYSDPWNSGCGTCHGDGQEIKPGPIVHCAKWELRTEEDE